MAEPREKPITAEQFYELPDNGLRQELLRGTLVSEPLTGWLHGRTVVRLSEILSTFVRARKLGTVFAGDPGFILARQPDTVRGPDVAFLTSERVRDLVKERPFVPGAPDLAVEVLSIHDRPREVLGKVSDYLVAGCRLVWVVDPAREEVSVFRSPFRLRVLAGEDTLDGEDVLPGFSVCLTEIFEP
jgi:Uma2 family endonuclease